MSDTSNTPTGEVEYDETDDNSEDSVLIDDPTYVGTDVIYKNSAYVVNEPMLSEPENGDEIVLGTVLTQDEVSKAEEQAQDTEANLAFEVDGTNPRQTWRTDTIHPSEKKKTAGVVASSIPQQAQSAEASTEEEEEATEDAGEDTSENRSPFA